MTIYSNLREWLDAAWLTKHGAKPFSLKELCKGSGINPPNYYRLEKGNPEVSTLEKLAKYFGVGVPERVVLAHDLPMPKGPLVEIRAAKRRLEAAEALLVSSTPAATADEPRSVQVLREAAKKQQPEPASQPRSRGKHSKAQ